MKFHPPSQLNFSRWSTSNPRNQLHHRLSISSEFRFDTLEFSIPFDLIMPRLFWRVKASCSNHYRCRSQSRSRSRNFASSYQRKKIPETVLRIHRVWCPQASHTDQNVSLSIKSHIKKIEINYNSRSGTRALHKKTWDEVRSAERAEDQCLNGLLLMPRSKSFHNSLLFLNSSGACYDDLP